MTTLIESLPHVHPSWKPLFKNALQQVDSHYLAKLNTSPHWLPGADKIFNAFSLPINQVHYVLLGESPYPRPESANGYAFWDANVGDIWSSTGLSKPVNRATSLRHLMKMLLVAEGLLGTEKTDQSAIASIPKNHLVSTNTMFFNNLLDRGFLLLNASLVLDPHSSPQKDAAAWRPFIRSIINQLIEKRPHLQLVLLGLIAHASYPSLGVPDIKKLEAEHPYNISFVTNPRVLAFFKPLRLLLRSSELSYS